MICSRMVQASKARSALSWTGSPSSSAVGGRPAASAAAPSPRAASASRTRLLKFAAAWAHWRARPWATQWRRQKACLSGAAAYARSRRMSAAGSQ